MIDWVEKAFPDYDKLMQSVEWGRLYREHGKKPITHAFQDAATKVLEDEDVPESKRKNAYEYAFTGEWELLHNRAFSSDQRKKMYRAQKGICAIDKVWYPIEEMDADHIIAWKKKGPPTIENGRMIHRKHNQAKGDK